MGADTDRIAEIAFHRYEIDERRMAAAIELRGDAAARHSKRFMLDPDGTRTKIKRSPSMDILVRAYVTRRMAVAARLLVLFEALRVERSANAPAAFDWQPTLTGAIVQLTRSVGGADYTQAAHTAAGQVYLRRHPPWHWAQAAGLKAEFVRWFADIFVVPDTINETDTYIDSDSAVANRDLFVRAVKTVLNDGTDPLATFRVYTRVLASRIAHCPEYLRFAPEAPDWALGIYREVTYRAPATVQRQLEPYRDQMLLSVQ
jgi:hypothetical protein